MQLVAFFDVSIERVCNAISILLSLHEDKVCDDLTERPNKSVAIRSEVKAET